MRDPTSDPVCIDTALQQIFNVCGHSQVYSGVPCKESGSFSSPASQLTESLYGNCSVPDVLISFDLSLV